MADTERKQPSQKGQMDLFWLGWFAGQLCDIEFIIDFVVAKMQISMNSSKRIELLINPNTWDLNIKD